MGDIIDLHERLKRVEETLQELLEELENQQDETIPKKVTD